jgi:hypothetical protein
MAGEWTFIPPTYGGFLSHGGPPSYHPFIQWEFQEPKMQVPTIYKAYFLCKGISPQNMALYGTNVAPF